MNQYWFSGFKWPKGYPKPIFVVPDNLVDEYREAFKDTAEIIPISETMLPVEPTI